MSLASRQSVTRSAGRNQTACATQGGEDARPAGGGDGRGEARACQDGDDLGLDLGREGEKVARLGAQERLLGDAVGAQGGADHGRGVEDDQAAAGSPRRFAIVGRELGVDGGVAQAGGACFGLGRGDRPGELARARAAG